MRTKPVTTDPPFQAASKNTVSSTFPVLRTSVIYGGPAKVYATIGPEAAPIVELATSLQALHLTTYVTLVFKFDKITTLSIDDSVMSECSVEHTNIVAESASRFDESDTSSHRRRNTQHRESQTSFAAKRV